MTKNMSCPIPAGPGDVIQLAHGGGGRWMHQLIEKLVLPAFSNPFLDARHDGALLHAAGGRIAFTTDSYVVRPLFFPGGDIGSLAVNGTINDLAMCGARPLALSAGLILEEGLPIDTLRRVLHSMAEAASASGVSIVTGDTKVVDKGKGDCIFINTAGLGLVENDTQIGPASVEPGDAVIVSGDLGRHGIAILSVREGLEFDGDILSDAAPLWEPVQAMIADGIRIHCLRDLTRGGLASALNEIAERRSVGIRIIEDRIPVDDAVRGASEILGLDPCYLPNEGRFVTFVAAEEADRVVSLLRRLPVSANAVLVGEVVRRHPSTVVLQTCLGGERVLDMLSGEQLPRIC